MTLTTMLLMAFDRNVLQIDAAAETQRLVEWLRRSVRENLRRRGAVIGISGGVDSAVVLALCVRALGAPYIVPVIMPERDSAPESEQLARTLATQLGLNPIREEITTALEGFGCYSRRDEAIRSVFPEYDAAAGYRAKISLPPDLLTGDTLNVFSLTVIRPDGSHMRQQLPAREFLQIVAASNFKQRARMAVLYYHAELRHFAVIGTANRNERQQGFFVKHGDAGVDCDPIVHLYKTQVYQLAEHLGVPQEIRQRTPTSDTYSAPCSQTEFFFRLPFDTMDLLCYAKQQRVSADEVGPVLAMSRSEVERAYGDLERKHRATEPLRQGPLQPPVREAQGLAGMRG
jgi:NAD+ synthase